MTLFRRPSRSADHLSNYWNALVRNAPPEELTRLARLVEPSEIAAIERAHAAHQRHEPDPAFARRLELTLMNTARLPLTGTIPQPRVVPPSRNGHRASRPLAYPGAGRARRHHGWVFAPAVVIGLVVLLAVASIGGIWLTDRFQSEPHRLMAPLVATPDAEASPGWTQWRGDAARSSVTNFGPVNQPVELWRFQADGACMAAPAVMGDTVYAACHDGNLYALNRNTGDVRWTFTAEPFGDVALAGDLVYVAHDVGDVNSRLYAVDRVTGEERWRYDAGPIQGGMAATDDLLVFRSPEGLLIGIDARTGEERWRTEVATEGGSSTPALAGGMAYAGSDEGTFTAVDAANGEIAWQVDTGDLWNGTAVVVDGIAYIGGGLDSTDGFLNAYDAETGELLWQRHEPISSPAVANGVGYSGTFNGIVHAFDTATGEELWRVDVGDENRSVTIGGDILYVSSDVSDRGVYALDAATGTELWHIEADGGIDSQAAVVDGEIYVTTTFGVVQALGESNASLPAASPEAVPGASPVAASDFAVEPLWQSTGNPDSPLVVPSGMAVAPDGTIWVVDSGNNRFQLFSPDGDYLETWGTPGDGEGEFNFGPSPYAPDEPMGGIAFAPDGSFYVADAANQRIQKFDADRTFLLSWGTEGEGEGQFLLPYWPAVAPNGNVYVVDGPRSDVQVFSPEGEYLSQLTGPGTEESQLSSLGSVTIADDGAVHVTDRFAGTIKTFAADGTYIDSWGGFGVHEGELRGPTSIAFDAAGNAFVTDLENGRIQVFSPDREFLGMWSQADATGTPFVVPLVVAVDDAGGVYITDLALGTIQKFEVAVPATPGATPAT